MWEAIFKFITTALDWYQERGERASKAYRAWRINYEINKAKRSDRDALLRSVDILPKETPRDSDK